VNDVSSENSLILYPSPRRPCSWNLPNVEGWSPTVQTRESMHDAAVPTQMNSDDTVIGLLGLDRGGGMMHYGAS